MNRVSNEEYLGIIIPSGDAFEWLTCRLNFICREVPVWIANSDADSYPLGLGYMSELSYYIGIHYARILNASAKAIVQCSEAQGLHEATDVHHSL